MQQAIENELSLKSQMDDDQQRFKDVDQALDGDREELRQERDALELMRIDFEQELHQARQEVAKSQDALKTAEDRVRSAEMIERQKLIAGMYPKHCCVARHNFSHACTMWRHALKRLTLQMSTPIDVVSCRL